MAQMKFCIVLAVLFHAKYSLCQDKISQVSNLRAKSIPALLSGTVNVQSTENDCCSKDGITCDNSLSSRCNNPFLCERRMCGGSWITINETQSPSGSPTSFSTKTLECQGEDSDDLVDVAVDPVCFLHRCQGDCDTDDNCIGDLICHQREAESDLPPPGCVGTPTGVWDYCGPANQKCQGEDSDDLVDVAVDPVCFLHRCQGDCDTDENCIGDLICHQRAAESDLPPPGCVGTPTEVWDYCGPANSQATTLDHLLRKNHFYTTSKSETDRARSGIATIMKVSQDVSRKHQ